LLDLGPRRRGRWNGKKDWERSVQEAKKEGMIVVGIPARAELRKELEAVFKPKFGIDMDLSTARGPQNASKIAAEFAAGVRSKRLERLERY
jgi:hypothetical protein